MTDYEFDEVAVYDQLGGVVRLARNARITVTDPATGVVAPDLKQAGQPVSWVTSSDRGAAQWTASLGSVRITAPNGLSRIVRSDTFLDEVASAPLAALAAQNAAEAAAADARAAAELAQAPSDTAVAALLTGTASDSRAALDDLTERRKVIDANKRGVKANGSTDDSAAWNALVASCAPGDVITWTGNSVLKAPILWKSGVSLIGQGRYGRSKLSTVDTTGTQHFSAIMFTPATTGASETNVLEGCEFAHFEVDGSGLTWATYAIDAKAIFTQFTHRCHFHHLYLHDTIGTALGTDFMPECLITDNLIVNGGRGWTLAANPAGHAGIGIGMGAYPVENVTIARNVVVGCGHWGIFVEQQVEKPYRSSGAKIIDNTVLDSRYIGIGDRGCTETIITGNHVYRSAGVGVLATYGAVDGLIANNIVTDGATDGIQFASEIGDGYTVQGNRVQRNGGRGIFFNATNRLYKGFTVNGNDVSRNWHQGICLQALDDPAAMLRDFTVQNNRVYENGKGAALPYGIHLEGNMHRPVITGNKVYDNQSTMTQTTALRFPTTSSRAVQWGIVQANELSGSATPINLGTGPTTGMRIRGNVGYASETSGSGTIADTTQTVVIAHGLGKAPTAAHVTPTGSTAELLWVSAIDATNITVKRAGTAGAQGFRWSAVVW